MEPRIDREPKPLPLLTGDAAHEESASYIDVHLKYLSEINAGVRGADTDGGPGAGLSYVRVCVRGAARPGFRS